MAENGQIPYDSGAFLNIAMSQLVQRAQLAGRLGSSHAGKRQLYDVLGYRESLRYEDFYAKFRRQDIARALVLAYPRATWKLRPKITDDAGSDTETPFEQAVTALFKDHKIYSTLERLDRSASLGQYGVLLVGIRDGLPLVQPLRTRTQGTLLYLAVYSERFADIHSFVTDTQSPDFGNVAYYELDLSRGRSSIRSGLTPGKQLVHASRCIHVAEDCLDDTVYAIPALEAVYNRLDDLEKVVGSSAEMFWMGAYRGLAAVLRDEYHLTEAELARMEEQIDEYQHGYRRWLALKGLDIQALQASISSPKETVDAQVTMMGAAKRIPKRILLGSERGELSADQDERNFASDVVARCVNFAEEQMLRPLLNLFILTGVIPAPRHGEYTVIWPDPLAPSDAEKAEVANKKSNAIRAYAGEGGGVLVVPVPEYREQVLGLPPESPFPTAQEEEDEEPLPEEEEPDDGETEEEDETEEA
jgi:hypothetical protein